MSPARKICSHVDSRGACSNLQPCPTHGKKAWAGSTRRERTVSGSRQQSRAKAVMLLHDGICHVCQRPGADQVDHVIPTAPAARLPEHQGLPDVLIESMENLRPIHEIPCHRVKTAAEAARARGMAA